MAVATFAIRILAQIAEFQAEFKKANKTLDDFKTEFTNVSNTVGTLAKGLASFFTAREIINFITATTNAASNIVDLSNKLGISTDAVQQFQFAATQTGTSVEAFSRAIFQLGNNLATGEGSAVAGIKALNLSLTDLQKLSPEDKFNTVAKAIAGLTTAQERNLALTQIFGTRTAQELAKAIDEYEELIEKAPKAGEAQVRGLEKAGDAADRFYAHLRKLSIEGLGGVVVAAEAVEPSVFRVSDAIRESGLAALAGAEHYDILRHAVLRLQPDLAKLFEAPKLPTPPPAPTQPGVFGAFDEKTAHQISEATKRLSDDAKRQSEAFLKAQKEADQYREAVKNLRDELSGTALQSDVKKLADAFAGFTPTQLASAAAMERVGAAAEQLRQKGAILTPALEKQADASVEAAKGLEEIKKSISSLDTIVSDLADAFESDLAEAMREVNGEIDQMNQRVEFMGDLSESNLAPAMKSIRDDIQGVADRVDFLGETFVESSVDLGALSQVLSQLSQVGGPFDGLLKNLATLVTAFDTADKSIDQFRAGLSAFKSGSILAGIAGITTGILGIVSAAISAGKAIGNLFRDVQHEKVNDLRDAFLLQFGPGGLGPESGFHTLARQLHDLGAAGDAMFQRLINAKKVDEFNAAIAKINEALGQQESRLANATAVMAEYGFSFEDAGAKFRAANLGAQFDVLYEKTLTLKEVGIDYDEILRRQADHYSELVSTAIRTNTEIDSSFKPILQRLADMGLLTDKATGEFIDLGKVTWAQSLKQGFDQVTKAIYDLRDALVGGVGTALDDLGRRRVRIPIGFDVDAVPQYAPRELALDVGTAEIQFAPTNGEPVAGSVTTILQLDGQTLAESTVPYIPGAVREYIGA